MASFHFCQGSFFPAGRKMLMGKREAIVEGAPPKAWQIRREVLEVGDGPCVSYPFRGEKDQKITLASGDMVSMGVTVGRSKLEATAEELVVSCFGLAGAIYKVKGPDLPGIAHHLASAAGPVGVWEGWAVALGLALEALGPRRSAALVWRLAGAYLVEPVLEWEDGIYRVLAGWLPGLFSMNGDRLELKAGAWRVVEWGVVVRGWLPDAPFGEGVPGVLNVRFTESQKQVLCDLGSGVGHRRWVALGGHAYADEPSRLVDGVVAAASMRGVRLSEVLCVTEKGGASVGGVLLGMGVLGVLVTGEVSEGRLEEWRSWLFPYAGFVAYDSLVVDPRFGGRARPYALVSYGVFQQYAGPALLSKSRRCLIVAEKAKVVSLVKDGAGVLARELGAMKSVGEGACLIMDVEDCVSLLGGEPAWFGGASVLLREVGVVLLAGSCVGWRLALRGLYGALGAGFEVRHSL